MVLSGQMTKSAPIFASFFTEESMSSPTAAQSLRSMHLVYSAKEWVCIETSG
jgi:hypothetical protein